MDNFFDLEVSTTAPSVKPATISDTFDGPTAFKFAFVGVGQAGGRIAATFNKLGYQRVCAINTAMADLHELKFPDYAKLDVGDQQGAGKDPSLASRLIESKGEDIFDLYTKCWGPDVDYAFVCLSAAGGTGAGTYAKAVEVAKRFMQHNKRPVRVGCIMSLPKDSDGQRGMINTLFSIERLAGLALSPIIFLDNERFKVLYGDRVSAAMEKPMSNSATAQLLHRFNQLAGTESEHQGGSTFDATDFSRILDSGVVTFASTSLQKWSAPTDITGPIREQLRNSTLATIDLEKGSTAGLLYIVNKPAWEGEQAVTAATLDAGTDMLHRMLKGKNAVVFPGVYPAEDTAPKIQILAMIGGLPYPVERLGDIASRAGSDADAIRRLLGV